MSIERWHDADNPSVKTLGFTATMILYIVFCYSCQHFHFWFLEKFSQIFFIDFTERSATT